MQMTEDSSAEQDVCHQEGCRFNQDGQCLEGLTIAECPHLRYTLEVSDQEFRNDSPIDLLPVVDTYSLFSAEEFVPESIQEVTFGNKPKLVVIIGEPNSGKTTLLSTLYEQFHNGPYCSYLFSGSRTSRGFERRCHKLRIASGLVRPTMDRTISSDFHFLHLSVRRDTLDRPAEHLLFADIAGERFSLARDSDVDAKRLTILNYTDQCFFIVDGEELAIKNRRFAAKQRLQNLIGRFVQNSMLAHCGEVHLVISKWDKVLEISSEEELETFFIEPMRQRFTGILSKIILLSAQPQTNALQQVSGLDTFFETCLSSKSRQIVEVSITLSERASQFQRFKFRKQ